MRNDYRAVNELIHRVADAYFAYKVGPDRAWDRLSAKLARAERALIRHLRAHGYCSQEVKPAPNCDLDYLPTSRKGHKP